MPWQDRHDQHGQRFRNKKHYNLSWPKLGQEPKFHDTGTFGGCGKCEQSFIRYPADI